MFSNECQLTPSFDSVSYLIQSETAYLNVQLAETETSQITAPKLKRSDYFLSSDFDEISDDDKQPPITPFVSPIDDSIIFETNGYHKVYKICDTLQGKLYKAAKVENPSNYVVIKKTNKFLFGKKIATEDGYNFCVSENILKEALILQYLTVDNQCIGDYIEKYIDFFESETNYYLVMEYIENEINLKQFISKSQQYIKCGKLSLKHYKKMIKYLLWQLCVTVQWLHISMHCCHLDLCAENIMIKNANFMQGRAGYFEIDPNISIKLCDFGVAEVFNEGFLCEKQGLSIINEGYFAPKVFHGDIYDARSADNWCLGMILFEAITIGQQLYSPLNMYMNSIKSGYFALRCHKLREYLGLHNNLKYFTKDSFALLNNLLNIDENKRLNGFGILQNKWFAMYYQRYQRQILKKFKHKHFEIHYKHFPFYH